MKKPFVACVVLVPLVAGAAMFSSLNVAASACTPVTEAGGLTAALVNPGNISGGLVDGSGCDIAVYYGAGADATIQSAVIHGAKRFGVYVNGDLGAAAVDILDSDINTIGDQPSFTGNQYGVAVYYRAFFAVGSATGRVSGNTISQYQKGAVVVNGPGANVQVQDNSITGFGPVSFIAQNGIQFGYGGNGSAMKNRVSGNQYTGTSTFSGGIIVVGGPGWEAFFGPAPEGQWQYSTGIQIVKNILTNNDVGVALQNYDEDFAIPGDQTNVKVVNNDLSNNAMTNGYPYQVGVSAVGNNDKIIGNTVAGAGYPTAVDAAYSTAPKVHATK